MQKLAAGIWLAILCLWLPLHAMAEAPWASGIPNTDSLSNLTSSISDPKLAAQVQARLSELDKLTGGGSATTGSQSIAAGGAMPAAGGPRPKNVTPQGLSEEAFSNLVNSALPMSPDQIVRLHSLFNSTQRAASTTPGVPPKPVSRTIMVRLEPGATPPVIRHYAGFITTLVFVDATGAAWPIEAFDLGNPKAFNINWNKKDNILMVQALTQSTVANLMIKMKDLPTPVMLTLVPDQVSVDYRVDLHVPGNGPNAQAIPVEGMPESANAVLLDILNGVAPLGSRILTVSGADCQAWLIGNKLYLRTRFKVLSPGWLATMSSADGTNAFELQRTPYVLLTGNGKMIPLNISGY